MMLTYILGTRIFKDRIGHLYGDVGMVFGEFDVRRADLTYVSNSRLDIVGDQAIEGPPDLCIEIISPTSRLLDRRDKFKQYEAVKVKYYWIVDPAKRTMEGYELVRKSYRLAGKGIKDDVITLPPFLDLQIPLSDLWTK